MCLFSETKKTELRIKLIDFGLGTFQNKKDIIKKCGTAGYVAPEILNTDTYNMMSDLYSTGVLMMIWYFVIFFQRSNRI